MGSLYDEIEFLRDIFRQNDYTGQWTSSALNPTIRVACPTTSQIQLLSCLMSGLS
jgi:hypothetical protein